MTSDVLSQFRSGLPDCDLVLYADFVSRTVLASDSTLQYPQEYLDALCDCAAGVFSILPPIEPVPVDHVIFATPTGARAFVRSDSAPAEALCCICGPNADFRAVIARAREAVTALGAAP